MTEALTVQLSLLDLPRSPDSPVSRLPDVENKPVDHQSIPSHQNQNPTNGLSARTINVNTESVIGISTASKGVAKSFPIWAIALIGTTVFAVVAVSLITGLYFGLRGGATTTTAMSTTSTTATTETTTSATTTTATTATTTTATTTTATTSTTTTSTSTTSTTSTSTTTTPTPPAANASVSIFCSCSAFTLSLTSITFSTVGYTFQWQSSPAGMNTWSNLSAPTSSSSYTVLNQYVPTDYRCILIRTGPPLMIFPSTSTSVGISYCPPTALSSGCSGSDTINNFILVGELNTRINDLATGCATGAYDNRTSQSVTLFANTVYTGIVSSQYSPSERIAIFIDFNDNYLFETTERIVLYSLTGTTNNQFNLTIPAIGSGAIAGVHRMRAALAYSTTPSGCQTGVSWGETHDYSVNIIPYASGSFVYSQSFTSGATSTAQCTAWTNFTAFLPLRPYTTLTLSGSVDPTGVSLTTSSVISGMVTALSTSSAYGLTTANGRSWAVGVCGSGYELSANGAVCACTTGYTVRPCRGTSGWGGINDASCTAGTQTMIVTFSY